MNEPLPFRRTAASSGPPDLPSVMARVARGDKGAFSVLYDALAPMVFGIVLRVVRDRAQSEEVAQEVMIDLWRQAARCRGDAGSVRAWAATIAHRRAVDRVRSAQAATDREQAQAAREHTTAFDEVAEQVETRLESEQVRRCLRGLTELQRPAALKQRTLDALDGVRQLPPRLNSAPVTRSLAERLRRKALLLGLAASLVAAASFAGLAVWQHQEVRQAQEQTQRAQQNLETISGILAAPDSRTVHGRAANGALTTVVTSTRQNKAVFTATGLPEPAAGRTYQLWLQHGGTMRPAGLIHQDGTVLVDGDPADATALGLTLEPSGGSPQPTTAPLLLMNMPA